MTTASAPGEVAAAGATSTAPALSADGVTVRFGGLIALSDVSIEVQPGEIAGLVGPNGAGKSTLLGVLSGLLRPNAGRVHLLGDDVTDTSPRARATRGLARTFQQPELFMGLTVREHLVLAYRAPHGAGTALAGHVRPSLPPAPVEGGDRAGRRPARPVATHPRGQGARGCAAARRRPPGRGRAGVGQRPACPPPRRAALGAGHEGVGEPALGVQADRGPQRASAVRGHRRARRRGGPGPLEHRVRARLRGTDRRRHPRGDPERPSGAIGLSRRRRAGGPHGPTPAPALHQVRAPVGEGT